MFSQQSLKTGSSGARASWSFIHDSPRSSSKPLQPSLTPEQYLVILLSSFVTWSFKAESNGSVEQRAEGCQTSVHFGSLAEDAMGAA